MKKRILSLLLLSAMLITGIPVMAVTSAETAQAATSSTTDHDYHDLYVQEGLVGLFTAFDKDDETVSLSNGTGSWSNRVDGGYQATLYGSFWRRTANGGIGYDLYRGAADDSTGKNYVDNPDANTYTTTTYLGFDKAMLPQDDFTVEYVAEYLPIYTRLTGETAGIGSKTVGEAYSFNEAGMTAAAGILSTGTDYFGYLAAFTGARDGRTSSSEVRGVVRWMAAADLDWNNNCIDPPNDTRKYNTTLGWKAGEDIFHKRGGIYTFAVMADEDTANGKNEATYTLLHDRAVLRTATVASYSFTKANGSVYTNLDYTVNATGSKNLFRLSHNLPTDFYVVRVYDRTLSTAEQAQNHVVDVLEYYNLAIDKTVAKENMSALVFMLASVGFEKDALEKMKTAKALQAKLDTAAYNSYNIVTDGLVAFFSAQGGNESTVDLAAGTWTDLYAGNVATLKQSTHWTLRENGFIGFNLYRGQANADGSGYVDSAVTNNYYNASKPTRLEFNIALLPQGDYTVDYMAEYKPVYTLLLGTTPEDITDEKIVGEAWDFHVNGSVTWSHQYYYGHAVESLGYLTGWAYCRDSNLGYLRNGLRWHVDKKWNGTSSGGDYAMGTEFNLGGDAGFRPRGAAHSYAIVRDVNVAGGANEATYSMVQDAAVRKSYTQNDTSKADFTVADPGHFFLSDDLPTDFLTLRVYNRALSEAELMRNSIVDRVAFFGVTLPENTFSDADVMAKVNAMLPAPSSSMSAQEISAKKILFESYFATIDMYVTDGLVAFFSGSKTFGDNVDLANGKWTDFVGGNVATLGTSSVWQMKDNGFLGFNIYRGQADADGSNYVDSVSTNNYSNSNIQLSLGIDLLPKGDYTIDYMAEYKPVYTLLTGSTDVIVGEAYDFKTANGITWEGQYWGPLYMNAVDKIGFLSTWTSCRDDNFDGKARGTVRWVAHADVGYSSAMGSGIGIDSVFHKQGGVYSFAIVRDKTEGVNKATFTLYHDAEMFKTATVENSTKVDFTVDDKGSFYLSRALPTDFFSLRIYNRALTQAELTQNALADKVLFYGITLPEGTLDDPDKIAEANARIPTPSSSMSAQDIAAMRAKVEELLDPEMLSLYVTDGLVALFAANGVFADTVDLAAGTWTDLYAGNVATLSGTTWKKNENGFVGFNIYRGQADQYGENYVDSVSTNNYYNSTGNPISRIDFGIALLPKGDFTVDYMAEYKAIYTLLAGTTDVVIGEAVNFNGSHWDLEPYSGDRRPVDTLGYLDGWTMSRDGMRSCSRGGIRFGVSNRSTGGDTAMGMAHGLDLLSNASFRPRGSARGYSFTRDEDIANGNNKATYAIWQDAVALKTSTRSDTSLADFTVDDNGTFYLSDCLPVDFFAIRIYDRALSDTELVRNMLVDKALFYGVTVPESVMKNSVKMASLNANIPAPSSDMSAQEIAALRLEIEQLLVPEADPVYVTDGLVAFFAAHGAYESTVNISAGKWTDFYGGNTATLTGGGWYLGDKGGIGFDIIRGMIDANGVYQDSSSFNTNTNMIRLDLSMDLLPDADYTVEYTAEYRPIYSVNTEGEIVGEMYDLNPTKVDGNELGWRGRGAIDQLGVLASWTGMRDASFEASVPRGAVRWMIYKNPNIRYYGKVTDDSNKDYYNYYMQPKSGETVFHKKDGVLTYAIVRDETTDGGKNEATYSLFHNGELHKSATVAKTVFTLNGSEDYNVDFAVDEPGSFFLSDALPVSFYTLRIYDRVLTAAEQRQNRAADVLEYYGVAIPLDFGEDEIRYEYVLSLCDTLSFEKDEVEYLAVKSTLQTAVMGTDKQLVTLLVGDKESSSVAYGGSYVLPLPAAETQNLLAWHQLDENGDVAVSYAPGETVTLSAAQTTFRALIVTSPETKYGISVKATPGDTFGMRFTASLNKADVIALINEFGEQNLQFSMLITPKQYAENAGGFTREALRDYLMQNAKDPAKAFIEIPSSGFYYVDESVCTLAGTIYNFTDVTVQKEISFAAIACIDIDTDNDGYMDRTVYGTYTSATCRSPKKAVESIDYMGITLTDRQRKWVDGFLANYTSKTFGGDKTVAEQRNEIESAFMEAMNTTVDYVVHPFAEGEVDEKYAHIQAISFDGLTMDGKKTRIFAYVGLPEGASAENPVPAMVLVHGGGGRAYMEWVRLWNERGYAAIAMETVGAFPVTPGSSASESSGATARVFPDYILDVINEEEYTIAPDRVMSTSFKEVDRQWQYHGLSAVILSHNVLRQNPAVDSSRIGATGVSWGGTMVSQVIGYDTRFAFAIPIYGTAYLAEPERSFISASYVDALWAAERRLNNFKNPIMWFAWADDNNFVMSSYNKSYLQSLNNNPQNTLVVLTDWRHGHAYAWNKEHSYAFADSICFPEEADYAYFLSQPNGQNASSSVALPAGATNVSVRIHYLTQPMEYRTFFKYFESSWLVEYWKTDNESLSIDPATGAITGIVPDKVRSYYISVRYTVDGVELETSSSFIMVR